MKFNPPRIESGPAMLLAGLRRTHSMAEAETSVPEQWREFRSAEIGDAGGRPTYGAICGADADRFDYLTGVEVENFDNLAADMGRVRIPAQRYAVFAHGGHVAELRLVWQHIWRDWLPQASYEDAETPPFELYPAGFDGESGEGGFEIWFPVRDKE